MIRQALTAVAGLLVLCAAAPAAAIRPVHPAVAASYGRPQAMTVATPTVTTGDHSNPKLDRFRRDVDSTALPMTARYRIAHGGIRLLWMSFQLVDTDTGRVVAGRTVYVRTISSGDQTWTVRCAIVTNTKGRGTCHGDPTTTVDNADAFFPGDDTYSVAENAIFD